MEKEEHKWYSGTMSDAERNQVTSYYRERYGDAQ